MNIQEKTVSALESKKKSLLSHIDQLEISVGRQVLQASAPMVEQQLSVDYAAAAGTKQQLLRNIAEIEELVKQNKNLETQARNLQVTLSAKEAQSNETLAAFGDLLYKNKNTAMPEIYKTHFEEAEHLEALENDYKQKAKEIEDSIENASFFQKLALQIKLSSAKNSALLQQNKIKQVFISAARIIVDAGEDALKGHAVTPELQKAFDSCINLNAEIEALKDKILEVAGETEVANQTLEQLGASEMSGKKRIAQINAEIAQVEINQDDLCRTAGRSYISRYCTKDGEIILDCEGIGTQEIESIAKERTELLSINRRIDIMQLNTALNDADKKISSLEHEAEEIRDKIANLEENASIVAEQIAAAHAAREVIIGKRTQLETEEGASVKLLKSTGEDQPASEKKPKKSKKTE
ncbi:MAG: hypothetical protein MJ159_05625 [Treponemataceae bacterium]|nr:hypothetical protein [Treponemataceae bacterium]